mgnify:CR=1 FL=1
MAKKTLILYYSWSGETKKMAEKINSEIKDRVLKEVKVSEGTFDADMYKTSDIALDQIQGKQDYPEAQLKDIDFNNW